MATGARMSRRTRRPSAAKAWVGRRNKFFEWDFYDVNGSCKVDAVDIAIVRSKFDLQAGNPGYARQFDRGPGANGWAPGAPTGKIDAVDIALVRAEFNHSCTAAP